METNNISVAEGGKHEVQTADMPHGLVSGIPEVAVVILNWNGKKYLERFLPSVLTSTYANLRIIVADNASTDDSLAYLSEYFPAVEIVCNPANEGYAKGYNSALNKIQSDYYVLLNSDVEVTKGWIEPVISLMEGDPAIAVCQPKILSYTNKDSFEYAGACGGWIDELGYPFARGRVFDVCEKDLGQYDDVQPCFWASGACLFVKSTIYHSMSGLDEYFFAHQEEIDFCWRLQLSGYKIYTQPQSVVYHLGGGTLPKGNNRKAFLNFRNNLVMMTKNMYLHSLLWVLPVRIFLDAIAAWRALLKGDAGFFAAVVKAHVHFLGWILSGSNKRKEFIKNKITLYGIYRGSIVWEHFIKKKKTFFEIIGNK